MCFFDTKIIWQNVIVWKEKRRWDAVRPFSAIRYLYGDQVLTLFSQGIKITRGGGGGKNVFLRYRTVWI